MPPTSLSVAGVQGLPFIISANSASRTEMTLPSWAKPGNRLDPGMHSWSLRDHPTRSREACRMPARMPSAPFGRGRGRRDRRQPMFSPSSSRISRSRMNRRGRHPEIIPHHHDRLDMLAVALPKGGDQFRVLLTPLGMQPLLELVQDQQHLALRVARRDPSASLPANQPAPILAAVQDRPCASP